MLLAKERTKPSSNTALLRHLQLRNLTNLCSHRQMMMIWWRLKILKIITTSWRRENKNFKARVHPQGDWKSKSSTSSRGKARMDNQASRAQWARANQMESPSRSWKWASTQRVSSRDRSLLTEGPHQIWFWSAIPYNRRGSIAWVSVRTTQSLRSMMRGHPFKANH